LGKKKKKLNEHHRIPIGRQKEDNYSGQLLPVDFHFYLHKVFDILTLDEIHSFLDIVYRKDKWTHKELKKLRKRLMLRSKYKGRT